jgi:chromosomal replication initiator protein
MAKKINPKVFWAEIIKYTIEKKELQETAIENWLKPLNPVKYADGILILETTNNFAPQVLNNRYRKKLCEAAKKIDENFIGMSFAVAGESEIANTEKKEGQYIQKSEGTTQKHIKSVFFAHSVNKQYTFNNFVNTYENRLAVGSALGIANSPGKMRQYNPFYIYGKSGVGKTHILHAMANEIEKNNPVYRVLWLTAEEFFRNYAAHLSKQIYNEFESVFDQSDIVIFDNIHELSGKREAQLELYKIFNKFHQQNKQIVFAANCSPSELNGFQERLISRFQWGLTVKLDIANIETRTAILASIAQKEKIKLSHELTAYIVENCSENIHELQGIITNIAVSASLNKSVITDDVVREALKKRNIEPIKGYYSPKTILEVVGSFYKIDLQDLKGKSRIAQVAWARQVTIYFLRNYTNLSLSQIGNELGGKNHSTILHSIKGVESKLNEERISKEIKEIGSVLARNQGKSYGEDRKKV